MALEGNLKDFALSEILQLISVQQKSGYLELVSTDNDHAEIWFDKGRIAYANQSSKPLNDQIKEYLTNTRKLTPEIVSRVINASTQSRISFEKVLVSGGYLTADELAEISAFIIEEMIHSLFKWQEGTYRFEADKERPSSPADISLKTEGLLMEGMRRIDEWPSILEKLPSEDMFIHPGEGNPDDYSLADEEKKIIDLVQSGIRLGELVRIGGMGSYRTYETVCNLAEVDLLDISEPSIDQEEAQKQTRKKINIGKFLRPILAFGVVILLTVAAFASLVGARALLNHLGFTKTSNRDVKIANMEQEMEAIQLALDVYLTSHFQYPPSLNELVEDGLLSSNQIRNDFKGQVYRYQLVDGNQSYILQSRYLPNEYTPE